MNGKTLVFYAGMLYAEFDSAQDYRKAYRDFPGEIYNGCYIYSRTLYSPHCEWFRGDLTPALPEDVPKELLTLVLLLT